MQVLLRSLRCPVANLDQSRAEAFPRTRWSLVVSCREVRSEIRRGAIEELCRAYWKPLYGYARMKGKSREDAEDLLQGYVAKILSNDDFCKADATRGKFRTFLLTGFSNFIRDEWRKETAQRRGGEDAPLSIDADEGEILLALPDASGVDPEAAFERNWAATVIDHTLNRVREDLATRGKEGEFDVLLPFLGMSDEPSYPAAAEALGRTVESTRVAVSRFRSAFQEAIRREIADTLEPGDDVEVELRALLAAYSGK